MRLTLAAIAIIGALVVLVIGVLIVGALVVLVVGILVIGVLIIVLDAVVVHFCAPPSCKHSLTDNRAFMQEKSEKN